MVQASLCFGRRTQGPCSAATRVPTAAESAPTKDTHRDPELWSPMSEMGAVPGAAVRPGSSCPAPTMRLMLLTVTGLPCNAHVYGHVAIGQREQQVPQLPSFTIFKVFVRYILHMKHLSSHNLFHNATLINYPELWCDTIVICHV